MVVLLLLLVTLLLLVVFLMSLLLLALVLLLLLLALVLLVLLLSLLLKLPKGPPRGRLGLYVAQRPATREAGTLGVACGCACGGGGAARGGKGGRIASFPLPRGSKSAVVLALVLVLPRIRHAEGWNLALPRGQPRGRLGFYVAQRPDTRESGT